MFKMIQLSSAIIKIKKKITVLIKAFLNQFVYITDQEPVFLLLQVNKYIYQLSVIINYQK